MPQAIPKPKTALRVGLILNIQPAIGLRSNKVLIIPPKAA
jgi:hypothetical protein